MAATIPRRVLVTGANKGIGLAVVERCLSEYDDTYVFLGSRNVERGNAAVQSLLEKNDSWSSRVECIQVDVGNEDSVVAAANSVKTKYDGEDKPLFAVLNNAGVGSGSVVQQVHVNFMGPYYVFQHLGALVQQNGYLSVVTSAAGPMFNNKAKAEVCEFLCMNENLDELMQKGAAWSKMAEGGNLTALCAELCHDNSMKWPEQDDGNQGYGVSKALANNLMKCFAAQGNIAHVNACTPGLIATDLLTDLYGDAVKNSGAKPPSEGAKTPVFTILEGIPTTGWYYGSDMNRSPLHRYRGGGDPVYDGSYETERAQN